MNRFIGHFAVVLPMVGAIYCLVYELGGADRFCFTEGCMVYRDFDLFGISLYLWGAAAFFALTLLSVFKRDNLAYRFSCAFLLIDSSLLIWLGFGPTCSGCLIVGIFFALVFMADAYIYIKKNPWRSTSMAAVCFMLWFFAFSPNILSIAKNSFKPWAIYLKGDRSVQIFFSPTCSSCMKTIEDMTDNGLEDVAFYPIAKNSDDEKIIGRMQNAIKKVNNIKEAFYKAIDSKNPGPPLDFPDSLMLKWRLLINRRSLFEAGRTTVPLIISDRLITGRHAETSGSDNLSQNPEECSIFSNSLCE